MQVQAIHKSSTRAVLCALIFVIVIVAYRLPFLSNVLIGEEGTHAYLVVGPEPVIKGDDALLAARLDGKDVLVFVDRNILLYQFLDVGARRVGQAFMLCHENSEACISIHARTPFLILFLAGVLTALFAVRNYLAFDRPWTLTVQLLALFWVLSAPLLVGGSIQPQIDGALGVLIVTTAAAFLLASDSRAAPLRYIAAFAGGLAGALGKNEWAIALAGSAVLVMVLSMGVTLATRSDRRDWRAFRQRFAVGAAILMGIIVCQIALYTYSPRTFVGGIHVMMRIDAMKLSIMDQLRRSWDLSYPVLLANGVALALIGIRLKEYCLKRPAVVIIAGWAATIAVGYTYSGFSGDGFQRYYCPAGMLASLALVCLIAGLNFSRTAFAAASVVLMVGIGVNSVSLARSYAQGLSITSAPGIPLSFVSNRYATQAKRDKMLPVLEWSGIAIYYRDVEWIATDLGVEGATNLLRIVRPDQPPRFLPPPQ